RHFVPALLLLISLLGMSPESVSAATSAVAPSDAAHPYVMQQAARQVATAHVGTPAPFQAGPKMVAVGGAGGGPQREVFGFALASSLADPSVGYPTWDFSLLTTVAYFGIHVQDDGNFVNDAGVTVWNSSQLSGLLTTAHSHGVKVVLTIILQDFSPGTPHMCAGLLHGGTTITAAVNAIKSKGVDGINIDYEGLNGSCGTSDSSGARHGMTNFAVAMRRAMPAGSYLSIDTYASSALDSLGFFDVRGLAGSVDSFFVMAYDLEYSNYARAPVSCSRFCLGPTAPLTSYYYNDTSTASQYLALVPPSKVILGVPYYGRKACVGAATPNQYPTGSVTADSYLDANQEYLQPQVRAGTYAGHRDVHDVAGKERWDTWFNTQLNCTREVYWDDVDALAQKYNLVNQAGLRGVGVWTLNYGGGARELWATLNTYFACTVSASATSPAGSTQFVLSLSTGSCNATSFDLKEFDSTLNQGWFPLMSVRAVNSAANAVLDGYPGHTYQVMARAHSTSGLTSSWTTTTVTVGSGATQSHPWKGLYTLDGYGGVQSDDSAPLMPSAYWNGWRIARAAHASSVPASGAVLDGYGGLHSYGTPLTLKTSAYWHGWDIARDFAFLPNGSGGYVLDGYGGLHAFSVNGAAMPGPVHASAYWQGWDIARKVVMFSDGTGGYVLDAWGGVHGFGIGAAAAPPLSNLSAYWHGWDIARGIALIPGTHSGYVLDGYGGVHGFAPPGTSIPANPATSAYWQGWNIARAVWLLPSSTPGAVSGYVLDGYGGLHPLGSAPAVARCPYWQGWDIAIGLAGA
ncbi:MAG: hypothetical protein E6I39_07005, partial [Chloroflexi bacterium]